MDTFLQLLINGLISGSMYGLIGISFGLIYSTTHFFHFSHGAMYALAAYLMVALLGYLGPTPLLAIPAAIALTGLAGFSIDYFVYAPLRRRRSGPLVLLLTSIGVFLVVQAIISLLFGSQLQILQNAEVNTQLSFFGARLTGLQLIGTITALLLYAFVVILMQWSLPGRVLRAVGTDSELARIVGVDENGVIRFAFFLGSALVGIAAIIAAYDTGLKPTMGFNALLVGIVAVIIGGVGSVSGAFVGGLVVGITQQFAAWVLPSRWQDLVVYMILVIVLIIRPSGIAGRSYEGSKA